MGLWDGNLRNSRGDILIDSVLLLITALAHFLQISQILNVGCTYGISLYFLLFNALFSNYQLANTLLLAACVWPTDTSPALKLIGNRELRGARALGAISGIVQVALKWACSMVIVAPSAAYTFTSSTSSGTSTSGTTISAIAFVHAALILFPTMAITLPKLSPQHLGTDIFTGFSAIVNIWISLALVTLQFYPQHLELQRTSGSPGSLSLLSLEIRAVVTIAVAVRWFQRFGMPNWESGYAPLTMWY